MPNVRIAKGLSNVKEPLTGNIGKLTKLVNILIRSLIPLSLE
jgi:hypothetical protein